MELNGGGIVARGLIWGATDKPSRYHIHIIIMESDPFDTEVRSRARPVRSGPQCPADDDLTGCSPSPRFTGF